ncbi:MAG TPA: hypothetical protein VMF90_21850 [Rhizobiaceae bacterium]|nr:hypothetical protein [Rhizobiaceae bacterium]
MAKIDIGKVVGGVVENVVTQALTKEAEKPSNDLKAKDIAKVAPPVAEKIEQAVKKQVQPVIDHLTNQEPWYRSRVIVGLAVSLILKAAAAAGVATDQLDPDSTTTAVIALISALADVYALYGRTIASKPIGQ